MVRVYIQSFWSPLLSSHTGVSSRLLQLDSPIGSETKESSKVHSLVFISPLWHHSSCPFFHHCLLHLYAHHYFGSCSFQLGIWCKMYSHLSRTLVLHDCDWWSPSQPLKLFIHHAVTHEFSFERNSKGIYVMTCDPGLRLVRVFRPYNIHVLLHIWSH
jgi:hypothetical protein